MNEERLTPNVPVTLEDGDLVQMGQRRLRVRLTPVPEAESEPAAEVTGSLAAETSPPGDEIPE